MKLKTLAALLLCNPAFAAITVGTSASGNSNDSNSAGSGITCVAGVCTLASFNNTGDTVRVSVADQEIFAPGSQLTGCAYGGVAMTLVLQEGPASDLYTYEYLLTAGQGAPTGSNDVVCIFNSTTYLIGIGATPYTGVNQSTPNRVPTGALSLATANPAVTPATQTSGDLLVASANDYCEALASAGTQTRETSQIPINSQTAFSMDHAASTGANGFSWTGTTCNGNTIWTAGSYALIPAPTPPTNPQAVQASSTKLLVAGTTFLVTISTVPAPTVTINVVPSSMALGQTATITWSSTNATSCTASGAWSGSKATSGSTTVSPAVGFYTYALSCTGTGGTGSNSAGLTVTANSVMYPRIGWQNAIFSNGNAAVITRCTHLDVCNLGDTFEGAAASGGYNRGTVVNQIIAGDGVVVPKAQQYVLDSYWQSGNPGNGSPIWAAIVNTHGPTGWFLTRTDLYPCSPTNSGNCDSTAHYHSTNPGDLSTNWQMNYASTLAGGMELAYASYINSYYHLGTAVVGCGGGSPPSDCADAAPNLSGTTHDNQWGAGNPQGTCGDYQDTGSSMLTCGGGAPNGWGQDPTNAALMRQGQLAYITWMRGNASSLFLMGNLAGLTPLSSTPGSPSTPACNCLLYQLPLTTMTYLNGALDAAEDEAGFGPQSWEHYYGLAETAKVIAWTAAAVKHPEYNMIYHDCVNTNTTPSGGWCGIPTIVCSGCDADLNASNGQAMRYSFTGTLVLSSGLHTIPDDLFWFDYYSVNVSNGTNQPARALDYVTQQASIAAGRYWIGQPIDAIQTGPIAGHTSWARRFLTSNGRTALALVNPSCNGGFACGTDTINLTSVYGGMWTHVTASVGGNNAGTYPTIDNGMTVGTVSVPPGDGEMLIQ